MRKALALAACLTVSTIAQAADGPRVIDGGETLFGQAKPADLAASYLLRKTLNSAQLPDAVPAPLRFHWPNRISVGFGFFCDGSDAPMIQQQVQLRLASSDDIAWLYSEQQSYLLPPGSTLNGKSGPPQANLDAIRRAKAGARTKLLLAGHSGGPDGADPMPRPQWIADHLAYLESLPFDGLMIYLKGQEYYGNSISHNGLLPTPIDARALRTVLQPIAGVRFQTLTTNLALVYAYDFPGALDEAGWNVTLANATVIARECRRAGLAGLVLDNEHYGNPCWSIGPGGTQDDHERAEFRHGQQFAAAIEASFPGAIMMTMVPPVWDNTDPLYALEPVFTAGMAAP